VLRGVLDEASEGLLALDAHGAIVEANATAAGMLGHDRKRLAGKPFVALVALADRREFRRCFGNLRPGAAETLKLRLLGRETPIHVRLRLLTAHAPQVVAVLLAEQAPLVAAPVHTHPPDRVEYFLLRFPYAVVALRPDLRVAFANGRARALLGRDAVRAGSAFGEGVTHDLLPLARRLTQVPAPLQGTDVQLGDGRSLRISGLAATGDEPAVMLIEDVTVTERTTRRMQEFLRNAAHQLRTPLAGIAAAVETLQAGAKENPEQRDRFLGHVETHADRLSRLARGLLTLARMEMGEPVMVEFVELAPLLDRLAGEAQPPGDVDVVARCPNGLAAIASPDLLREALASLLDNALQHTREGEVSLTAAQENGRVTLSVADAGPGILPEFLDRVFEPFFRLSPSGDGYGLGLAIAAQAVRAMRGEITVSSSVGEGTIFTVTLPSATVVQ
jgi:two-component system, OmpR family, phosphate regulon sensor histidine kinase PhoR